MNKLFLCLCYSLDEEKLVSVYILYIMCVYIDYIYITVQFGLFNFIDTFCSTVKIGQIGLLFVFSQIPL